jgi:hypothetical protein
MSEWVPFFQTLLWISLIGGSLWRFNSQVTDLLEAIRDRVSSGANIKAGPFELGQSPPSQSAADQKREISAEVAEATTTTTTPDPSILPAQIRTDAFLAEDLSIRELQLEFGVSIGRHVALGRDGGIDGMFAKDGRGYFVETKYLRRPIPHDLVSKTIDQFRRYVSRFHYKNVAMVFVVVFDYDSVDLDSEKNKIEELVAEADFDVHVRAYSFNQLKQKFDL